MASAYIHLSRWSGKCLYTSEQDGVASAYIHQVSQSRWSGKCLYTSEQEWQVASGVAYIHLSRWSGKCLYTSEQVEWQVPTYI